MAFLDEFNKETARGAALTAAAMLDDILEKVLKAFLIEGKSAEAILEGFNAPLGTLSARGAAAHAMGLISEREYAELEIIRKIRNEFAHSVHVSFETDKVVSLCKRMTYDAKPYGDCRAGPR